MNLRPGVDNVAGVVKKIVFAAFRRNGELSAAELRVADTQIHSVVEHNGIFLCRGFELQIFGEK